MGKKSKKQKQQVADYHMSIHMGICSGPVDAIKRIFIGEKEVFNGNITGSQSLNIDKTDLFGGPQKEGGVSGVINLLFGDSAQVLPNNLAGKFGLTSTTAPGFRGLLSAWFHSGKSKPGFYWSTNSPYVKPSWFTVFRKSPGLNAAYQTIPTTVYVPADGDTPASSYVVSDSNPANIIYECLTDNDWGMGGSVTSIDTASFLTAQQTLHGEQFGLSMQWVNSTTIEAFVTEVLDHINATLFVHPFTGLLTIKLIRADYNVATLFHVTPDNAELDSFQRKMWGETVNEIVATWTNPVNEQEESVTSQDLANIAMQGGIVSDSRNYYGVRSAALCKKLANRDVRIASAPLVTAEAIVDRTGWALVPGDVCILEWPEYGVAEVAMRVMKIDYGKIGDSKVRVSLAEDIFSLVQPTYTEPPRTEWTDPTVNPVDFAHAKLMTAPYLVMEGELGTTETEALTYPESIGVFLAAQPNEATFGYNLLAETLNSQGNTVFEQTANLSPVPSTALSSALLWQSPTSTMNVNPYSASEAPAVGWFAVIGDAGTPETVTELCYVTAGGGTSFTIQRGILDTIPRAWPIGTRVWFFAEGMALTENEIHSASETADYKMLSRTSAGTLPEGLAALRTLDYSDRPWLPSRPANVLVAGTSNGEVEIVEPVATIAVSWSNRNRLEEPVPVLAWNAGSVTGEVGQTTTVRLVDTYDNSVIAEHTGLTGTSFNIPIASTGAYPVIKVIVTAVRDGLESFQAQDVTIKFPGRIGYGRSWGYNYGSP
jgi:hypothetical protein